jgi:hypothetical protein
MNPWPDCANAAEANTGTLAAIVNLKIEFLSTAIASPWLGLSLDQSFFVQLTPNLPYSMPETIAHTCKVAPQLRLNVGCHLQVLCPQKISPNRSVARQTLCSEAV